MATITLTGDGARIAHLANLLQGAALEASGNTSVAIVVSDTFTVTAPVSGKVLVA